jgi:large subunit ribosomal protein L18
MDKKTARLRRARRSRGRIRRQGDTRLSVYRTPRHIYAQIVTPEGDRTLAAASTLDKEIGAQIDFGGNVAAAKLVGKAVAEKARSAGVQRVAFDRSGYRYHGRVKALAETARENGLQF